MRLNVERDKGPASIDVVVKIKPTDDEVLVMLNGMAGNCEARLAKAYREFSARLGFAGCHVRELALYAEADPRFARYAPGCYKIFRDDEREAYVLVLEQLRDVVLKDTADDISGWTQPHIESAIRGIADFHSIWLGREAELAQQPWIGHVMTLDDMVEMQRLWELLGVHAYEEFPKWFSEQDLLAYRDVLRAIPDWWAKFESMPRTLIHNDFNPRNICLRGSDHRLCAYDWELATLHVPQHDVAELLSFVLTPTVQPAVVDHYVELHRVCLEQAAGVTLDPVQWRLGFDPSLRDLVVNRLSQYVMAHTFRHYAFLERTVRTVRRLLSFSAGASHLK